jgi:hypothetical protein
MASEKVIQPLGGLVISGISLDTFTSKYPDIPIGLCKVKDAVSLSDNEIFAITHNIPLFAGVNLFYYTFASLNPSDINDLKSFYSNVSEYDMQEKDRVLSAMLYGVEEKGQQLSYTEKKEPEINITYKTISSKKGPTIIPERHVEYSNEVVTYFLLNPFGKPEKVRINPFEIAKIYDIDSSFYNTLVIRKKYENESVDFTGFYVDVPGKVVSQNYFDILKTSLQKFSSYIHERKKNLIVENLTKETLSLGMYGDIVGVKIKGNDFEILRDARLNFKDKIVFAAYSGDFSAVRNIENFLNECILYGIYPEFQRDTSTGDFLYYENYFVESSKILKNSLNAINLFNRATFVEERLVNGARIVQFGKYPFMFFVVDYDGNLRVSLDKNLFDNVSSFKIVDSDDNPVHFVSENDSINMDTFVSGVKILRVVPDGFYPVYLGTFPLNSSTKGSNTFFINAGSDPGNLEVKFNFKNYEKNENLELKTLEVQSFYNENMPDTVSVNGIDYEMPYKKQNFNVSGLLLLIFLAFYLFLLLSSKLKIKKHINLRIFFLLAVVLPIALIVLNALFIHYASIVITFFVFSLLFLIVAFNQNENSRVLILTSYLLFLMGLIFNYFEFGSLLPSVFNQILPFKLYENFFFYIPFIITVLFFQSFQGKKVTKLELILIILSLSLVLFYFDNLSLPFEFELKARSLYPMFVLFIGNIVLQVFKRPVKLGGIIFSIVPVILAFISIFLSQLFYNPGLLEPGLVNFTMILKEVHLFAIPFFFISLYLYNIDKKPGGSLFIKLVFTILGIFIISNYILQYYIRNGNPVVSSLGFIINPVLITLMLLFLLEKSPDENF